MITLDCPTLILKFSPLLAGEWSSFLKNIVLWAIVIILVYLVLFYGLRLLFRQLEMETVLVTLKVSQIPLLAILLLVGLKFSFLSLAEAKLIPWLDRGLTALIVAAASYWIAQLFPRVIAYFLKKYAQQTEAMWDDVLVPLLNRALPFIIYLIGSFLFFQTLGLNLTGLWVILTGAILVLAFVLKDILADFFSGLILLFDAPFQFGDVISLPDGSTAVIKKIGIRLTKLLLIDTHCELFVPNGTLQRQKLINLSRPAPHYHYSLNLPLRADTEPAQTLTILKEVVLAHPDTLGNIEEKLQSLDNYYKFTEEATPVNERNRLKKEAGRERLLAEQQVNKQLQNIYQNLKDLRDNIQRLETEKLETDKIRNLQSSYLDIAKLIGLDVVIDRHSKRRIARLEEAADGDTLIQAVRKWYKAWSQDPDLTEEDPYTLQEEWERKIELLKRRVNQLFQKISQPQVDERKLNDYVVEFIKWLDERFKSVQTSWQEPKIWTNPITDDPALPTMEYVVKFYVDHIKLEQCQRGYRVKSEVYGEMIRQLRQSLYVEVKNELNVPSLLKEL